MNPFKVFFSAVMVLMVLLFFSSLSGADGPGAKYGRSGLLIKSKSGPDVQGAAYVQGELLVKFKPGTSESAKADAHRRLGSTVVREFSFGAQHIRLRKGLSVRQAIEEYRRNPNIEYAEPNYLVHTSERIPNDPYFNYMWDMKNTGQNGGTPGADMKSTYAWDLSTGSSNVVVTVIDTGVDYNHEDMAANMWTNTGEIPGNGIDDDGNGYIDDIHGWNSVACEEYDGMGNCLVPGQPDGDPMDSYGHGTHCAGTIGATGNNGTGVTGINWNVKVMACRFINNQGSGTTADAVACLDYVKAMKDRGVNIVATSNSWGGGPADSTLLEAIRAQMNDDILFIAAAGNNGWDTDTSVVYPANYNLPNIISVAATDRTDAMPWWSDYGRHSIYVGAPGVDIVSLRAAGTDLYGDGRHFIPDGDPNAKYYRMSGTSMATPHVTGLAALLKSQDTARDWKTIKNLILAGGADIPSTSYSTISGKRIDAYGSLTCSDKPVFAIIKYPKTVQPGVSTLLSALSINCSQPVGPVTVTTPDGTVELLDNGMDYDTAAGDGIFTGTWVPSSTSANLVFSSPLGNIDPYFMITTELLPPGSIYYEYMPQTLSVQSGTPPYAWSLSSGNLPPGLTFDPNTGVISGRPSTTGNFTFTVVVTDANSLRTGRSLMINVRDDKLPALWKTEYTNSYVKLSDMAVDSSGNIDLASGNYAFAYPNQTDYLTLKFDSSGHLVWEKGYNASDYDYTTGIKVDSNGYLYVTGYANIHGTYMGQNNDYLTMKYDPSGNPVWMESYDGGGDDYATDIALDSSGNIYVSGYYNYNYDHNCQTLKYDNAGNLLWSRVFSMGTPNSSAAGNSIGVDAAGNAYVVGTFDYGNGIDTGTLILKYDTNGNLVWMRTLAGWSANKGTADSQGNIYITGMLDADLIVFKYDTNGDPVWSRTYDTGCNDGGLDAAVDTAGNIYIGGQSYCFGDRTYPTVLKYDPAGNLVWRRIQEQGPNDMLNDVQADGNGYVYMAGIHDNGEGSYDSASIYLYKYSVLYGIATSSLAPAKTGIAYAQMLLADGGQAPYSYSIISGSLPAGLSLDGATGTISGTPAEAGTFTFTVQGTSADSQADSKELSISVTDPVVITTQSLPDGTAGVAYNQSVSVSGGLAPYTWILTEGGLPSGLALDETTGVISGTPSSAGSYSFTVQVKDANLESASRAYTIKVSALTTYYMYTKSHCANTTYTTGPQYATLGETSGDCSLEDAVSITFRGTQDMLEGYAANGGYGSDIIVTGQVSGNSLSFLAKGSNGTGYVKLVEVNPATGAVISTLATKSIALTANVEGYVTDLSGLTGTVHKGNTFGIMLTINTTSRSTNEVRWGKTNGGAGLEQWFTVSETPVSGGANQAPAANANGPYSGMVNEPVAFSSAGSNDPDGGTLAYLWDFGDGNYSTDANPTHSYAGIGTYTVTLTITDSAGTSGYSSTTALIGYPYGMNQHPVSNAGPDVTAAERTVITFDGSGSYDIDGTITNFSWDFGDGTTGSGVSATHSYTKTGTYTVTLTVTDDKGATGRDTAIATITR